MQEFDSRTFLMKNGIPCTLRLPKKEDAEQLLAMFRTMAGQTDYILAYPEDIHYTVEGEERFIEGSLQNEDQLLLVAEIDGKIVGDCQIDRMRMLKNRHRGVIGIGMIKDVWNQGIGTEMFREMIAQGKRWGLEQIELDFVEGNKRARALYEKMGFRIISYLPNALHLKDGCVAGEYKMMKSMED